MNYDTIGYVYLYWNNCENYYTVLYLQLTSVIDV